MFEHLVLRKRDDTEGPIDAGLLIESMVYYQNVHVLLDRSSLNSILRIIDIDDLCYLLKNNNVKATYIIDTLGTHSNNSAGFSVHDFVSFRFAGHKDTGRLTRKHDARYEEIRKIVGERRKASRANRIFGDYVPIKELNYINKEEETITDQSRMEIKDSDFVNNVAKELLKIYVPNFQVPEDWYFRPISFGGEFMIDTNFDFEKVQQMHNKSGVREVSFTPAFLINHIHNAIADLNIFMRYGSAIAVSPASQMVFQKKVGTVINNKRDSAVNEIDLFEDYTLEGARAIREAVNGGDKTFKEIVKLIEKSRQFREWIKDVHPEKRLLEEYISEASSSSWAERLPAKMMRYGAFTGSGVIMDMMGAGGVGTIFGAASSAFDSLFFDRIVKGYKPNQFIENSARKFVK